MELAAMTAMAMVAPGMSHRRDEKDRRLIAYGSPPGWASMVEGTVDSDCFSVPIRIDMISTSVSIALALADECVEARSQG